MKNLHLLALASAALAPVSAQAAVDDFQFWSTISASGKIAENVQGQVELVGRAVDDIGRVGQFEARAVMSTPISKSITVGIGYVHVVTYATAGRDTLEETPFAQLNWNMGKLFGGALTSRTRIENRFQRGALGMALRMRSQVKLSVPLKKSGPNLVLSVEPFYSFNRTSAVRPGIDQVRSFLGLGFKLAKHLDMEAGYLNQYLNRAPSDRSNHAISLSASYKF